jgi:hypothetical protein
LNIQKPHSWLRRVAAAMTMCLVLLLLLPLLLLGFFHLLPFG